MEIHEFLIDKISIVNQQGSATYWVGLQINGITVDRIQLTQILVDGYDHQRYCGFAADGKLLFTVDPASPCVVEYK